MAVNIPAHDIVGKKEEGLIWATNKENEERAAKDPPLPPLTPKQYWAQTEDNAADAAAAQVKVANPEDP